MSAAILREAAALIRERAEAASPSPWVQTMWPREVPGVYSQAIEDTREFDPEIARTLDKPDAEHIASWHPAVTLKVAKSLDQAAAILDEADSGPLAMAMNAIAEPLVEVARAYLATP